MKRIRGLKSLVHAAVEHGSRAVEKVQIEMAKTPFDVLEQVPPLKVPVSIVRLAYNAGVGTTHTMIRVVNKVVEETLDAVLDQVTPPDAEKAESAGEPAKTDKSEKSDTPDAPDAPDAPDPPADAPVKGDGPPG